MITTVTLNAAIDKTYFMPSLETGQVNRVQRMYSEPGGKGINVAKVLHTLGVDVTTTGFIGGFNGRYIGQRLEAQNIQHDFVTVAGEARLCLNVVDETNGIQTEILEAGPVIDEAEWGRLLEKIEVLAAKSQFVVFSGSLPQGLSSDAYAQLIRVTHQQGAKAVVDTSGAALEKALVAQPFMVKPNREELAAFMGKDAVSEPDVVQMVKKWRAEGIPLVVVSLGAEGAITSYEDALYKVTPPPIEVVNPVGCGDTFVAGMVAGFVQGLDIEETLSLATAAAAVNATVPEAGSVTTDEVTTLKEQVKIQPL